MPRRRTVTVTNLLTSKTLSNRIVVQSNRLVIKIHIVILFDGDQHLQYLNSLLKSIFYYQNKRFRYDIKSCCYADFCDRFINGNEHDHGNHTVKSHMATTYITVIHFLVTTITSNRRLMNLMNTWKLRNMEYYFYNCNNYLVIVLDTDILLNTDIIELWNHFENFSQTQSIGIGLEQNPHFQDVMPKLESDWEGYGYNNGVLLFDLSKIRLTLWNELWIVMTRNVLNNHGYLITGEQI
ncbi:glycosyltransferase-related [Schistosoma mansoni]|uniref:glycosyltransferase-related n=1 Tax=Schistosoma mansoni TaxID=6183 RepID=UPI0001A63979|nr:glycosyltransferase-related [Schistosoma mansoni]|eukprot:XP_018646703.1 glycosyltransferase-related [Schistosoma mansoni]